MNKSRMTRWGSKLSASKGERNLESNPVRRRPGHPAGRIPFGQRHAGGFSEALDDAESVRSAPTIGDLLRNRAYVGSLLVSCIVYLVCGAVLRFAGNYAESVSVPPSHDLFLAWLPVIDLTLISDIGFKAFIVAAIAYLACSRPAQAPYILTTLGLFLLVRAVLFSVTVLGPPAMHVDDHPFSEHLMSFKGLYFTQDLFPSGHAGKPFLMFLLAEDRQWKRLFLACTVVLSAVVLFNHVHYTVDVLGAYFVSYGIYRFGFCVLRSRFAFDEHSCVEGRRELMPNGATIRPAQSG